MITSPNNKHFIIFQIFWEHELYGDNYENYKSVFCTLYMLMRFPSVEFDNDCFIPSISGIQNQQKQPSIPANSKDPFKIFVKTMTGKTTTIEVFPQWKIEQVKSLVEKIEGISPERQRLIFDGKQIIKIINIFIF